MGIPPCNFSETKLDVIQLPHCIAASFPNIVTFSTLGGRTKNFVVTREAISHKASGPGNVIHANWEPESLIYADVYLEVLHSYKPPQYISILSDKKISPRPHPDKFR